MPITEFQRSVMLLLKQNRHPNSYVAGGIAIHRRDSSRRYSNDVDFFHDADEAVSASAQADIETLESHGFQVEHLIEQPSFIRVVINRKRDSLKLEWVRDTAFRFLPIVEDEDLGYRLHDVDLAVNKCLALANRTEVRDILDLIQLHEEVLSLPSICWAACGKDPGFTPDLLLDCMRRHSIIRPEQLAAESLTNPPSPPELKRFWLTLLEETEQILPLFPAADLGCIYLDDKGRYYTINQPFRT